MNKMVLWLGLLLFLLADTGYSFVQHFNMPLDGDLSCVVLPDGMYQHIWDDPLGWNTISSQQPTITPNRFFAHYATRTWFRSVPFFLQRFMSPIDSLYATAALAKTLIQILILLLLSAYAHLHQKPESRNFLLLAELIVRTYYEAQGKTVYYIREIIQNK